MIQPLRETDIRGRRKGEIYRTIIRHRALFTLITINYLPLGGVINGSNVRKRLWRATISTNLRRCRPIPAFHPAVHVEINPLLKRNS